MNQKFKSILVVQDAYRDMVDAMEWASLLISPSGKIKILDVQPPFSEFWKDLFSEEYEQTPALHRDRLLSQLAKGINFPTSNLETRVRRGTPVVEIVRESLRGQYDLVIKESFAKASDLIFGNLDMRLMRYCPTPVWMVNPATGRACTKVLVAINPEAGEQEMLLNQRLLDYASSVAKGFNCKLFVVAAFHSHEYMYPVLDSKLLKRAEQHTKMARRHARETLDNLIANSLKKIDPKNIVLEDGRPNEVILSAVDKVQPDLLVMGSIARHGITGLMFGNTAEQVLRKVNCSMLTIKPSDFVCPITVDELNAGDSAEGRFAF